MGNSVPVLAIGVPELIGVVSSLVLAIYTLMKFFLKGFIARITSLEKSVGELKVNSVTRTEFNQTIKTMREEIRAGNAETHRRLDQLLLKRAG